MIGDPLAEAHILQAIYRLRYQVYVEEWGFEKPEDHPGGLETDAYDRHAIHIYAWCGQPVNVIGTARLILNSGLGFPIEQHFDLQNFPLDDGRNKIAEISRLSISKQYRRREIDRMIFSRGEADPRELVKQQNELDSLPGQEERRKCEHELIRDIYLLIYRESLKLGLTHWYAVMARGLQVMLGRWGIPFEQIGPARQYHGIRAPFVLSISTLEKCLMKKNPGLLELARQTVQD